MEEIHRAVQADEQKRNRFWLQRQRKGDTEIETHRMAAETRVKWEGRSEKRGRRTNITERKKDERGVKRKRDKQGT